jgi:hypothetical protein
LLTRLPQVGLVYRDGLDASNLLLRGCTLRKTEWVIGVVVFTGGCVWVRGPPGCRSSGALGPGHRDL